MLIAITWIAMWAQQTGRNELKNIYENDDDYDSCNNHNNNPSNVIDIMES